MILSSMGKNGAILALFALLTTGAVATIFSLTKDSIAEQERKQLSSQLQEVLDAHLYDNALYEDCALIENDLLSARDSQTVYRARKNGQNIALVMRHVTPKGYSGNIHLLTAVFANGEIAGVRVTKHEETPGLGDKIELRKSPWITVFKDQTVLSTDDNRWAVKKDGGNFDQFTGATITPRAVVGSVKDAVLFAQQHFDDVFAAENACLAGQL
ncbi:electron transport complex subunit RsxG [Pseudoalteromonas sp. NEC-BIFX-2020_015]|uniref:electron transport complex subunit RsxG n=1 Tax=Pseudoalteromonas sp. NEC-BIFX-2020_015 TaxID=2729544 RepID=UPI0014616411|nr:electron transport complex subunit RsxG [Pseudoalteromonas sp. NEC-BIFX-2020_015]NMR26648.1 electron transport complex subunit RsxG [Pseudoalteromonas sp. NEC-BIFX-2020_015]